MAKSERTKKLIKRRNIFFALSVLTWIGVALFTVISVFCLVEAKDSEGTPIFAPEFKQLLISLGVTTIIGIVCTLVIKDKLRTAIWMLCLILCTVMYKSVGMYSILGAWFIDEYVFHTFYNYYKTRVTINKEIDLREE